MVLGVIARTPESLANCTYRCVQGRFMFLCFFCTSAILSTAFNSCQASRDVLELAICELHVNI